MLRFKTCVSTGFNRAPSATIRILEAYLPGQRWSPSTENSATRVSKAVPPPPFPVPPPLPRIMNRKYLRGNWADFNSNLQGGGGRPVGGVFALPVEKGNYYGRHFVEMSEGEEGGEPRFYGTVRRWSFICTHEK